MKNHIISNSIKFTPGFSCLKQPVYAMIKTKSGKEYFGSNTTNNKVDVCPRVTLNCKSGEGYEHCKSTCDQNAHAEVMAIKAAMKHESNLQGAKLFLVGHTYCCDNCLLEMKKAGITDYEIIE